MTTVGFEPTPFQTSALNWRLRPLGQVITISTHTLLYTTHTKYMHNYTSFCTLTCPTLSPTTIVISAHPLYAYLSKHIAHPLP